MKTDKKKQYDLLSPDGITIRGIEKDYFNHIDEIEPYFNEWLKQYERQGYYASNNYGRLPLVDVARLCDLVEL